MELIGKFSIVTIQLIFNIYIYIIVPRILSVLIVVVLNKFNKKKAKKIDTQYLGITSYFVGFIIII